MEKKMNASQCIEKKKDGKKQWSFTFTFRDDKCSAQMSSVKLKDSMKS